MNILFAEDGYREWINIQNETWKVKTNIISRIFVLLLTLVRRILRQRIDK